MPAPPTRIARASARTASSRSSPARGPRGRSRHDDPARPRAGGRTARRRPPGPRHRGRRVLMKGNEAMAEAAIRAGCDAYFGYPITPQAELLEWMARRMPEEGRPFVQAERELGAINMALGAAATGRAGPRQLVLARDQPDGRGDELHGRLRAPGRASSTSCAAGPGLGSIGPSQSDYFQATKGHGHGDYRVPVLAPASIGEAMALTADAFELAERYRTPVIILTDGILGQAMEPVELTFREPPRIDAPTGRRPARPGGRRGSSARSTSSPRTSRRTTCTSRRSIAAIADREVRRDGEHLDDADLVIVAYGTAARVARTAIARAREAGLRVGLFRPITLWPFPSDALRDLAGRVRGLLVVEMSAGQMVEDVRLAVEGGCPVAFTAAPAAWCRRRARSWRPCAPLGGRRRAAPRRPADERRRSPRAPASSSAARSSSPTAPPATAPAAATASSTASSPRSSASSASGRGPSPSPRSAAPSSPTTTSGSTSSRRPTAAHRPSRPGSGGSARTPSSSPTRATATSRRSAPARSSTRPPAASSSPRSSSTTGSTG